MAAVQELTADNLSEFIMKVNEVKGKTSTDVLWFRGQADSDYDLEPSIVRGGKSVALEPELLNRFKAKAYPFSTNKQNTDWEWLFIMQHFGVPTRLLDWSEEALIALTFALFYRKEKHNDKHAVVWCLEPIRLNQNFNFNNQTPLGMIPNIEEKEVSNLFDIKHNQSMHAVDKPIAIVGPLNNERIIAQRGVFTLFPPCKQIVKLNAFPNSSEFLYKIVIPSDKVDGIKTELKNIGIKATNLFPELKSVAQEVIEGIY